MLLACINYVAVKALSYANAEGGIDYSAKALTDVIWDAPDKTPGPATVTLFSEIADNLLSLAAVEKALPTIANMSLGSVGFYVKSLKSTYDVMTDTSVLSSTDKHSYLE